MKKSVLIYKSFLNAFGVLVYISLVTLLLSSGQVIFGEDKEAIIPIFMLLLLVISASITGFLVLGRPILMYIDKQKKEAFFMLFSTIGWLAVFLITIGATMLIIN